MESWLYSELGDCLSTRRRLTWTWKLPQEQGLSTSNKPQKHWPLHILNSFHHDHPNIPPLLSPKGPQIITPTLHPNTPQIRTDTNIRLHQHHRPRAVPPRPPREVVLGRLAHAHERRPRPRDRDVDACAPRAEVCGCAPARRAGRGLVEELRVECDGLVRGLGRREGERGEEDGGGGEGEAHFGWLGLGYTR